ncbi:MAG: carboxypeptidase-like regulatory domain-containing protein, partial [Planctomycetota bacterium]
VLVPLTLGGMWTMKKLALVAVVLVVAWVGYRETRRAPRASVTASVDSTAALAPALAPSTEVVETVLPSSARTEVAAPDLTPESERVGAATVVVTASWDPDGEAAADLGLVLLPATGDARELRAREARTDANGHARLEELASGPWVLHDERGGELELELAPGEERHVELLLPTMKSVTGRVVDEDGRGIPGAELWLERMGGTSRGSPLLDGRVVARTDERGEFRLRGLRSENALGAFAPGFAPAPLALLRQLAPLPGAGELEVRLVLTHGARRLVGRVLDADGVPCPGALLVLGTKGNHVRGEHWSARGRLFVSTEEGRFSVDWIAPEWDAEAPELLLAVLAPEHALLLVPSSEVFAALEGELVLRLQRGARVTGRVCSVSGEAVAGAQVEVLSCAGLNAAAVPFRLPSASANALGDFALAHVTSGEVRVTAWSEEDRGVRGHRDGRLVDGADYTLDFVLGQLAAIRGRVVDEQGRPLADRDILVANGRGASAITSGADGRFEFLPEDPEAEWTFSLVGSSGYDDQRMGVKPGQDVVLVARRHAGVVVGSFRDAAGAAQPGKVLQAELVTIGDLIIEIAAELDGAGAYRFEQVAAGEYQMHITCGGDSIASSQTFTLEAGGFRDVGELVSR